MLQQTALNSFETEVKSKLPFTPNANQTIAITKICKFIFNTYERSVFVLKGYAGTGKTNLISAFTKALPTVKWRSVLLAPTGRAAKVLGNYSGLTAYTIHKKIFKKQIGADGVLYFTLAENLHKNTLFIVDEASMISADSGNSQQLFNNLLENLFEYVYSGINCKLILIGDTAQLPPVGSNDSPALNPNYLKSTFYLNIFLYELTEVARQRLESGILLNATNLRSNLATGIFKLPKLMCTPDVVKLNGDELEDTINSVVSNFGEENVIIITRSNKRANLFNQNFRNRIHFFEDDLCAGDKLMIVKNNYFWLPETNGEAGFIANGDMAEIKKITKRETNYGFNFCDCILNFTDYPNLPDQEVKIITNCLFTDSPALSTEEQKALFNNVLADASNEPIKALRLNFVKNSSYYNALQVKFSYAITCHKSQGGQWPIVFIDQGFLNDESVDEGFIRWLYTALTRATEKVYLINFNEAFFE